MSTATMFTTKVACLIFLKCIWLLLWILSAAAAEQPRTRNKTQLRIELSNKRSRAQTKLQWYYLWFIWRRIWQETGRAGIMLAMRELCATFVHLVRCTNETLFRTLSLSNVAYMFLGCANRTFRASVKSWGTFFVCMSFTCSRFTIVCNNSLWERIGCSTLCPFVHSTYNTIPGNAERAGEEAYGTSFFQRKLTIKSLV